MKDLVRRPGFRLLLIGQGVSAFGDWMSTVAFMALVLDVSGSSTAVAGILVLRLAPAAFAGPLATRAVRRWNRRTTMLTMDIVRAAMVVLIPLVSALWWIYVWAFLIEVAGLVFLPARDAAVPDLVDGEELPTANGLVLGSSYGTMPFGAAAFAAISTVLATGHGRSHATYWAVFVVDALTFLVSFAAIWRIRELSGARAATEVDEHEGSFHQALRLPEVRAVGPASVVIALGLGALFSLGIVYVRKILGASMTDFGLLIALFGVGAAIGLAVLRTLHIKRLTTVRYAVGLQGITVMVMSLSPNVGITYLGALGFGGATAVALTSAVSELQERLDGPERVMAFAVFHVAIRGGLAVSAILAGIAADALGSVSWPLVGHVPAVRVVLFACGALVALASGSVRPPRQRRRRENGVSRSSSAPASRGSPSSRSLMMLRWI